MNKFFLIVNMDKDTELKITYKLCGYLDSRNKKYNLKKLYPLSDDENKRQVYADEVDNDTDAIIILGGDGSFLHSAVALAGLKIPVLGLNLGTLGYLAQLNSECFESELENLFAGRFYIEDRKMLSGVLIRNGEIIKSDRSLNDIVVRRCDGLSAIRLNVKLNGKLMKDCISDGLIVATPTGSTAYNLSVGGSIVEPSANVFAVSPIAPHSLSDRCTIVSDESEIEIGLAYVKRNETADVLIGFDGKFMTKMLPGDILRVKKSDETVKLIRLDGYNFFEVLQNKMRTS